MADLPLAELPQFLPRGFFSFFKTHHRQQFLPKESVRHAQDVHIDNLGMPQQELFDFAGKDIFATANDHLFEASYDIEIAMRIHCCQVSSMQPSLAINRPVGRFFHLVIASHHLVPTAAEFSWLPTGHDVTASRIDQLNFTMR